MRWIATLWDIFTALVVFAAVSIGTVSVHSPNVISAEPTNDLPALSEEQFLDMEAFKPVGRNPVPLAAGSAT